MAEAYLQTESPGHDLDALRARILPALQSCDTEADIVQVLYALLRPVFGYEIVSLTVLEHEGWAHNIAVDAGVLQDRRRRPLADITTGHLIERGVTTVLHPVQRQDAGEDEEGHLPVEQTRGPGAMRYPRTIVLVPTAHQEQILGAVSYQSYDPRAVPQSEIAFLEDIHRQLGVLIANARLNETTRDQAMRLTALNAVARSLSETLDERGVVNALRSTLSQLLTVDAFELAVWSGRDRDKVRLLTHTEGKGLRARVVSPNSTALGAMKDVLITGHSNVIDRASGQPYSSATYVAVKEGGLVRGAFSIHAYAPEAYEESTVNFLEQVADQVALALRNAWSYSESEAQRRRLEVVNAVGRRLASSLDKWSIMRTLREELSRHLEFDGFILATITETPEGAIAEGYQYVAGVEQPVYAVPLAVAGPSREAYETRQPVLLRRSPWARSVEARHPQEESLIVGEGVAAFVARGPAGRVAARSLVWVPVMHGERVTALLSLQSYHTNAFGEGDVQLLQDVAAHVSLALANADHFMSAQRERRRLEALHAIELGVAGSADEQQIAEAVFTATRKYVDASHLVLAYLDAQGRVTGFGSEQGKPPHQLAALPIEKTGFFRRLMDNPQTTTARVEGTPEQLAASAWTTEDPRLPKTVLWVPVLQGGRVVAALSAQRLEDNPFEEVDIELLESAAPLVGISLRTVRLHRSNELALEHSVRIQEVAALAGHDLAGVVSNVAEQARSMLGSSGVACWAFDADGRVSVHASSGDRMADKVLDWAEKEHEPGWTPTSQETVKGSAKGIGWDLIPLWYADRLVGALGAVHGLDRVEEPGGPALDFARHAAIAIENARLVAETRGRIHTLEAVAAFTELDPTQPAGTRAEIGRLVERALQGSAGGLWLLEAGHLVKVSEGPATRLKVGDAAWLLDAFRGRGHTRQLRQLLRAATGNGSEPYAYPILVDGQLAGMVTAQPGGASPAETRRLMSVLAGQAGVVLGRLWLVDALDRERRMMNAILRHSPVGVILQDSLGRIVYANPAVERMYDVPATSMVGHTSAEVLSVAGATPATGSEGAEGDVAEFQIGETDRTVRVRTVPIPGLEDEPAGTLSMHEDVTEQRRVMEAKDLMLRAIGHEVRSPAAAMKSTLAGLVQWRGEMNPEQRQVLIEEAYEMSDRLLNLVENQLIIAKLETRRFEPNPAPVALSQAMDQVLGVLWHRYGDRTSQVQVKIDPKLPEAYCEPTHLNQVLTNLIGNALEYTQASIRVGARTRSSWLEITISDDGPGVPAERVESLFEKTAPAGQNRARGGLGLGLYLCRLVVERSFGGRIWLESPNGHGATFRFTVPTVAVAAKAPAAGVR